METTPRRSPSQAPDTPRVSLIEKPNGVTVEETAGGGGRWEARVRAGVMPGRVRFQVTVADSPPASGEIEVLPDWRDSLHDGTPDFLRLDDEHDRQAFRRWFTFLAEAQYFQAPAARPVEIVDCAALIRYAYREALHAHDDAWTGAAQTSADPAIRFGSKYQYPSTPLGAALFRVRSGALQPSELPLALSPNSRTRRVVALELPPGKPRAFGGPAWRPAVLPAERPRNVSQHDLPRPEPDLEGWQTVFGVSHRTGRGRSRRDPAPGGGRTDAVSAV